MAKKIPCSVCGELKWPTFPKPGYTPPEKHICRSCRSDNPKPKPVLICGKCEQPFSARSTRQRYCSRRCANAANNPVIRAPQDARTYRRARERDAPGLTSNQRSKLLARWIRQQRACIYCDAQATTVDHVLPLVRGGTNHEGNLAPCCKSCNSRKAGWTVIEWRSGRRLPPMTTVLPWQYVLRRVVTPKPKPEPPKPKPCMICHAETMWLACSPDCRAEWSRRQMRDRYRAAHGLKVDPSEPTKPWRRTRLEVQGLLF